MFIVGEKDDYNIGRWNLIYFIFEFYCEVLMRYVLFGFIWVVGEVEK